VSALSPVEAPPDREQQPELDLVAHELGGGPLPLPVGECGGCVECETSVECECETCEYCPACNGPGLCACDTPCIARG
jgi:hypothetical protein